MTLRMPVAAFFCLFLAACATAPGKPAAPAVTAVSANDQLYAVAWQQDAVDRAARQR